MTFSSTTDHVGQSTAQNNSADFAFLGDTSTLGAVIRAFDWSQTSLGPISSWSPVVRTTISLMLQSPIPMITLWGPEGLMIYNDGYAVIAGPRHPEILGSKVREGWPEVADFNSYVLEVVLHGGTLSYRDQHLVLARSGVLEDAWLDLTYSPVLDQQGDAIGVLAVVVETTQRVLEAQQRKAVERHFQFALDAGTIIGAWDWDIPNNMVIADERFARFFSQDSAQLAQGIPLELVVESIHPDDRARVTDLIAQTVATGAAYSAEYRVLQLDGSYRWLQANGRCEFDADGKPLRFPGVLIDIDERKRSEQALRESQEELQLIADAIPELVSYLDNALMYRFVNRAYEVWLGLPREQIIGRTALDILGSAWYTKHGPAFERALAGDEVTYETVLEHYGRQRDSEFRLFPRRNAQGEVQGVYAFVLDISDRKRAQEALLQLNQGLEQQVQERTRERDRIWNVSSDLLGVADQNGIWLTINPAWHRTLGWNENQIVGRTSEWMEHPDDVAKTRAEIEYLADGNTTLHFENRFRTIDNHYCWLSWTAVPLDNLLYCVARDITVEKEHQAELAQMQEQLRQAQKMEAIGQLTGGIAHDFNNLLTGIISALDLLQRRVAAGRINEIDRYVDVATTAAKRAAALTHRLLAFSRRQSLDVKPLDVNGLIISLEDLLRRTMGESIALEFVLAIDVWSAMTDANQLENALLNLCINARDAMPNGGQLTVETANTSLDESYTREFDELEPGDFVVVSVSDTGVGMTHEVIARAFDPFFTTKPIGQGTGLGLSMIYGFTKQSGGHIRMYSEIGQGTTVKLYLPRNVAEREISFEQDLGERPRAAAGESVLIVEDDEAVRMVIMEVLHDLGYQALEASDATTAIPQLESNARIDLLVTDVGLPGTNGRQLAEMARQRRPELPVLFVTGYAEGAAIRGGFLEPGMEMISKPFDIDVLAAKIRAIIERG